MSEVSCLVATPAKAGGAKRRRSPGRKQTPEAGAQRKATNAEHMVAMV